MLKNFEENKSQFNLIKIYSIILINIFNLKLYFNFIIY